MVLTLKYDTMDFFKLKMLSLLLMDKNETFANTYDLIRVLSRMFGIFDSSSIINSIESEHFVTIVKTVYGVHYYCLTDLGKATLKEHKGDLIIALKHLYPDKKDFIELLE